MRFGASREDLILSTIHGVVKSRTGLSDLAHTHKEGLVLMFPLVLLFSLGLGDIRATGLPEWGQ